MQSSQHDELSLTLFHRNEIASCEESAYNSLPLKDAALLLFFSSQSELLAFAQQVECYGIMLYSLFSSYIQCRGAGK